ncbi:MAG: ATP-dependent helicase [Nanoarchaeota archaeon]
MISRKEKPNEPEELINVLHPLVRQWFFSKFETFSLPQLFGVMEVHSRRNILVSAPTGATKTLTGFMSILNELIGAADQGMLEDHVYCIYISPLKALNEDIKVNLLGPLSEMEALAGKKLGIRVAVRTGDTTATEKSKMLEKPPHILITTPESLAIMLSSIKFADHLKKVEWCIIDEVHALAENKRGVHLSLSLERLQRIAGPMTRIGLSATIAPLEEVAAFLVGFEGGKPRDCLVIDVQFIKKMDLAVISPSEDLISITFEDMHSRLYTLIDKLIQEHRTTLIFTNTRSATERVVDHLKENFPKNYTDNIGAHHGSLSKEHRHHIETALREGKLKAVVSSTSLELGIDIGFIDLVLLLGSPKSVARALQRQGRSGHKLHDTTKGRIIVLDRDDLVECAVLLKNALERKIDTIHIPRNALDVLAQHIYGIAIGERIKVDELFRLLRQSYCYHDLKREDLQGVIDYLAGKFASLEDRHIYAKIWHDETTGEIGRRGKMARVLYMTNIGTIPDESFVTVKVGDRPIGKLDEAFLERLKRGDVFVLGGEKYQFLYAKGMVAFVNASVQRPPTIPSWVSEMLPLSFDLASEIGKFRRLMDEKLAKRRTPAEIQAFIQEYLYVDDTAAKAIFGYFEEQFKFSEIPHDKKILVEHYIDGSRRTIVFHTLFGRRVNDCLSRAVAFAISRLDHRDVEIGVNDNGFYLVTEKSINAMKAFSMIKADKLRMLMELAIERTEILKRRFRHCATRSLMILRSYHGQTKRVGRQQVSSQILLNAVKRISNDFSILKEARREVLEDLMDIDHARLVLERIEKGEIKVKEVQTQLPSPFAFNLVLASSTDLLKMEDRMEFLKRMHDMVLAKISLNQR